MRKLIDLHIHTNISDGVLSPKEVIDEAYRNNASVISIADHDTIDAYTDEIFEYAKSKNIILIPGVEISAKAERSGVHILGYNFDINNKNLKEKLHQVRNARHKYLHEVAERLEKIGYIVNVNELDKIDSVTKAHIAIDIINNKKNEKILLKDFNEIPTKGDFIERLMNEGCIAYVEKDSITPKEAAGIIRQAGGKAILAHPVAYEYEDGLNEKDILEIVKDMNADGIESNYIYIDQSNKKVNESYKWNQFAKKYNLITTIGSDFHKKDGIHKEIGLIDDLVLPDEELEKIISNLKKK